MKKMVKEYKETNLTCNACVEKFYGLESFDRRGFITRTDFASGDFIVIAARQVTNGNCWPVFVSKNIVELIENLINNSFNVFEFDTGKELSLWLAQEK